VRENGVLDRGSHEAATRRVVLVTALALAGVAVVLLTVPQALGAQRVLGIAQLISFRAPLAIGLGTLALLVCLIATVRRRRRPVFARGLALILAVGAIANGAVLVTRGSAGEALPHGDLVVMAWNAQGGATSPVEVAQVAGASRADVVSLPETDEDAAAEVARLLAQQGISMTPHTVRAEGEYDWIPTSVLIADDLGDYEFDASAGTTPGLPSGVWKKTAGTGPASIVAVHPLPPLPDTMGGWVAGLKWVAGICISSGSDVVVAGDVNATVDHMAGLGTDGHLIGRCDDAALETRSASSGTWPSDAPSWIGSPIDHVLFGSSWTAKGVRVVDGDPGGTDHGAIVVVLDRR